MIPTDDRRPEALDRHRPDAYPEPVQRTKDDRMSLPVASIDTARRQRRFSVPAYLGLVVGYLFLLQGLGWLLTRGLDTAYAAPTTIEALVRGMTIPIGLSLGLGLAVVAVLRWWRPAFVEPRRVQPWVIAIPIIQAVTILGVINLSRATSST